MISVQRRFVTKLAGGLTVLVLTSVALTACSSGPAASSCAAAPSGIQSNSVTVTGKFGKAPDVTFATPMHVTTTQASTITAGTGDELNAQQDVVTDLIALDGTTGKVLASTAFAGTKNAASQQISQLASKGLAKAFTCARVGSRFVAVIPPSQSFPSGTFQSIGKTDSIVVVADVLKAYLAKADGTPQVMAGDLPSVVLAPSGQPGITIPAGEAAPKTLRVANLRDGSGAVIRKGDTAIVQYTGVLWSDGSVFDSTWTAAGASPFVVKNATGVPSGLVTALTGQRVGSQVLVVAPPAQGFGAAGSGSVPGGATLVYVVDVLGKA